MGSISVQETTLLNILAKRARGQASTNVLDGSIKCDREWFDSFVGLVAEHCALIVEGAPDRHHAAATIRAAFPRPKG